MGENEENFQNLLGDMLTEEKPDFGKNDALGRAQYAERLTSIVKDVAKHQSYTMSLHGVWGTGKTYLLRGWQKQLQEKDSHFQHRPRVVYFNAWEDDFQVDALTAIVGQLWEDIKSSDWEEIRESLKTAIPSIAEVTALGFLGLKKEYLQSPAERTVDEYVAVREKLGVLKERLGELAAAVKTETGFPLVFIVDELDRCRPTFAIEVLERVKHLFGAPNIVFVFGVNKTELQKSIKSVYGEIETEDYLRRFFDIDLTLPPASAEAYCLHLLQKHRDLEFALSLHAQAQDGSWKAGAEDLLAPLAGYMDLSLRQVEHAIRFLRLAINTQVGQGMVSEEAWGIALLILLKIKHPDMYEEFIAGKCQCADIINHFHGILAPHAGEQKVHRQGEDARDAFSLVEAALYRFGKEREIKDGLQAVLAAPGQNKPPSSAKNCLADRTKDRNTGSAVSVWNIIREMGDHYWLPLKKAVALLGLVDDLRR